MDGPTIVDRLRSLIEITRTADFEAATSAGVDLAGLENQLADVAAALEPHVVHDEIRAQAMLRMSDLDGVADELRAGDLPDVSGDRPEEIFPYSPVIGPMNALAPPLHFRYEDGHVYGTGRFGSAYNGPPTGTHGGLVAAAMDELLGLTGVMTGNHGFTGTLSIRYERLTPLDQDLELHGWVERKDGRKTFIVGEITHDGHVTARAEGIFITPAGYSEAD